MKRSRQVPFIAISSFLIGALMVYLTIRAKPEWFLKPDRRSTQTEILHDFADREQDVFKHFNEQFGDDFFRNNDPFENMRKFREQMGEGLDPDEDEFVLKDPFDRWFGKKFGGGTINDITQREDNDFVYYEIKVDDLQSASIDTKVEGGYIVISGKQEKKSKEGNSISESIFHRSFPVPPHVDSSKMQTTSDGEKIVIRFPKEKSSS